jgi:hypothetical protein
MKRPILITLFIVVTTWICFLAYDMFTLYQGMKGDWANRRDVSFNDTVFYFESGNAKVDRTVNVTNQAQHNRSTTTWLKHSKTAK